MSNVRVTLPAELHELVRDAVAEIESATGTLGLGGQGPRPRAPRRERRGTPQATILRLLETGETVPVATAAAPSVAPRTPFPAPPGAPALAPAAPIAPAAFMAPPAMPLPAPTNPAGPAVADAPPPPAEVPITPAPPRRGAFLARVEVPSSVPGMRLPARTRRLPVACRRASPLDAARTSRMLRMAVPCAPVAPAPFTSPPAWLLAAMASPGAAAAPEAGAPVEPAPGVLAGRPAPSAAAIRVPETLTPLPASSAAALAPPLAIPAPADDRRPFWRQAAGHVGNLLIAAALALVTLFCCAMVGLVATSHHLEEVVTGSMQPTIPIGSLVVTEQLPAGQLQVGNILVFPDPNNTKLTIVHRIVWLSHDQTGDVLVRTKGDYNALADSWTIKRQATADAARVIYIIPGGGTFAGYLQVLGFWGLLVLIAGVIGYYGLRKVRQILNEDETDATVAEPSR